MLTAFYMFRMWFLVFAGEPRGFPTAADEAYAHATDEEHALAHDHDHDTPRRRQCDQVLDDDTLTAMATTATRPRMLTRASRS